MPDRPSRRFGLSLARGSKLPSERDWERSPVLEPLLAPRHPRMVSDGGGLSFPPTALAGAPAPLDLEDPAVGALIAQLSLRETPMHAAAAARRSGEPPPLPNLDGWRLLARSDDEALFGRGRPPQLLTAAVQRDARRGTWVYVATSAARPLRATRDGIRASSWRLSPEHEVAPADRTLRILLTEQAFASGQRATGRVLPPDLHVGPDELVLTMFVTPRPGFQSGTRNPETPVRVALAEPVGTRRLIDGALADL